MLSGTVGEANNLATAGEYTVNIPRYVQDTGEVHRIHPASFRLLAGLGEAMVDTVTLTDQNCGMALILERYIINKRRLGPEHSLETLDASAWCLPE